VSPKNAFYGMIGLLIFSVIFGLLSFYLIEKGLTNRSHSISELKADEEIALRQVQIYEATQQKVEELSFINDIAEEVLPSDKSQALVVEELRKFAKESGTQIRSLEFGEGAAQNANQQLTQTTTIEGLPGVRVLPANLTLREGLSYDQFLKFLKKWLLYYPGIPKIRIKLAAKPNENSIDSTRS